MNQNQNPGQTERSLMRYRSAPSSFFANLLDDDCFLSPNNNDLQQPQFQLDSYDFLHYDSSTPATATHLPNLINNNGIFNPANHISMNSNASNLIAQSSSPSPFLSSFDAETDFRGMREVEKRISSNRLNNHISFSSGPSSSSMILPHIAENKTDSTFKTLKRTRDGDSITLDKQKGICGHYTPSLVHHMSLPKTFSQMATAEKLLRFDQDSNSIATQDSVLCKIRAKRGFATHPRSIAERVRRTRISNRMKKLQELFPTIDKQTSTADMLDLSVQHIKKLQKDLQTLQDARARCTCSSKQ